MTLLGLLLGAIGALVVMTVIVVFVYRRRQQRSLISVAPLLEPEAESQVGGPFAIVPSSNSTRLPTHHTSQPVRNRDLIGQEKENEAMAKSDSSDNADMESSPTHHTSQPVRNRDLIGQEKENEAMAKSDSSDNADFQSVVPQMTMLTCSEERAAMLTRLGRSWSKQSEYITIGVGQSSGHVQPPQPPETRASDKPPSPLPGRPSFLAGMPGRMGTPSPDLEAGWARSSGHDDLPGQMGSSVEPCDSDDEELH